MNEQLLKLIIEKTANKLSEDEIIGLYTKIAEEVSEVGREDEPNFLYPKTKELADLLKQYSKYIYNTLVKNGIINDPAGMPLSNFTIYDSQAEGEAIFGPSKSNNYGVSIIFSKDILGDETKYIDLDGTKVYYQKSTE